MRTPPSSFPPGFFSKVDTIHVHVDGGIAVELVKTIVDRLDHEGFPSRLTFIQDSVAGPQRQDLPPTYQSHTPGTDELEQLEFFSTTLFPDLGKTKRELWRLLSDLSNQKSIVVEAERVIGRIDQNVEWTKTPPREFSIIRTDDVGFHRATTLAVEIHYACDISKEEAWQESPPFSPARLLDYCAEANIRVGGWFLFEKKDVWAYRSNMFVGADVSPERVKKERDDLAQQLNSAGVELGFKCQIKALVEQSLGVWKTPLNEWHPPLQMIDYLYVEDLAKWEEEFENLRGFWVVAPNFLGDIRDEVYQAMIRNLGRRVEYTYFLRSFADVQRLRQFARRLVQEVPFLYELMRAVLLTSRATDMQFGQGIFQKEYFIANPLEPNPQGYRLVRLEDKTISGGLLMLPSEIDRIVGELKVLTEPSREAQGLRVPIEPDDTERPVARAVIYTDLKDSTHFQEELGDAPWERVLLDYDLIVAREVSRFGGEVVKNLGDGYLLIFDQAGDALRCAGSIQTRIRTHNAKIIQGSQQPKIPPHKIALDFGYVCRVMRAQGFDYTGKTLSRCARLIQIAGGNQILMLKTFRDNARTAFPHTWINDNSKLVGPAVKFKGLEGTYEIWEFLWS
jgi:class 3 adenylate cyclase